MRLVFWCCFWFWLAFGAACALAEPVLLPIGMIDMRPVPGLKPAVVAFGLEPASIALPVHDIVHPKPVRPDPIAGYVLWCIFAGCMLIAASLLCFISASRNRNLGSCEKRKPARDLVDDADAPEPDAYGLNRTYDLGSGVMKRTSHVGRHIDRYS